MRAQRVWLYAFLCGFAFQLLSCVIQYPVQSLFRQTFLMWSWLQYAMLGAMIPRIVKKLRLSLPVHFLLMVRPGLAAPVRREQYQLFRLVLCGRNANAGL